MSSNICPPWKLAALLAAAFSLLPIVAAGGQYNLAYWREVGNYENAGNHSAYVHVWDENGQPLPVPRDDPTVVDSLFESEHTFIGQALRGEKEVKKS